MPLSTYLTFLAASFVIIVIPGPTLMLIIGHALTHGSRRCLWSCLGVLLGDVTALGCSLLGLGAFLQTSAHLFTLLKWAGALYLVFLGLKMLRAAPSGAARSVGNPSSRASALRLLSQAYLVTTLNPKSILFFVAFVPQFLTPGPDVPGQMLLILCSYVSMGFLCALTYATLAGSARRAVRAPGFTRAATRLGGCVLVAAGIWTAAREAG